MATIELDTGSIADYQRFLAVKSLPVFRFRGHTAIVPDEYANRVGLKAVRSRDAGYEPHRVAFDYQAAISEIAIRKRKFSIFADCGLGKTLMLLEFAKHALRSLPKRKRALIVSPLMVIPQTVAESERFYGDELPIQIVRVAGINEWMQSGKSRLAITNYEAMNDIERADSLGCLVLDESSMLKSHYGTWARKILEIGRGVEWKLCCTGTPAPNDRIEYANHAVFMDRFPNVNAFLATFFVNRGQTDNRWELKPHALKPFYRALADWSIFLVNPASYGWKGADRTVPPMHVHIHHVETTAAQRSIVQDRSGNLIPVKAGGIKERGMLSQVAKGHYRGQEIETNKPAFIRSLVESWPDEQTIIWCWYNSEQEAMAATFPEAASISGETPIEERLILLDWFCGRICTCERQRRIRNTCENITARIRTNGNLGRQSSGPDITPLVASNTQPTTASRQGPGWRQKTGSKGTQKNDSPKDSNGTASLATNTEGSMSRSRDDAQSAVQPKGSIKGNRDICTSITTMPAEESAGCSADIATTASENLETIQHYSKRPQCTCGGIKNGRIMISKPRVLGFGLNLQCCTRQVFSGLVDSYEAYYQAVKRSNRYGSSRPLNVHIPITDLEAPMVESVLRKCKMVQQDADEQERIFRDAFAAR